MKKLLFALSLLICSIVSFSQKQYPVTQRPGGDSVLSDYKGAVRGRIIIYTFVDTLTANAQDISGYKGAHIFVGNTVYVRDSTATKWIISGSGIINNSTTVINIIDTTIVGQTTISICTGDGSCDTSIVTTTVNNISTATFKNDSTIILCNLIGMCDTVHIPPQQLYVFQNGLNSPSPGIAELGGTFNHSVTLNTNGTNLVFTETQTGGITINQLQSGSNAAFQLNNLGSVSLGFKGNGDIISSNTDINLRGFNNFSNLVAKFNGGLKFPFYDATVNNGPIQFVLGTDNVGNVVRGTIPTSTGCGLNFGGIISSDSSLNIDISPSSFCINGSSYQTGQSFLTLVAPDSLPYYAAIVGDTLGNVSVIYSDESANPIFPQPDPASQVLFTYILLNPGDTSITSLLSSIPYDQNVEWTTSATGLATNYNNTNFPLHLTIAADVGAFTNGDHLDFYDSTGTHDLNNFTLLKFYIRLKSAFSNAARLRFSWFNGNTQISTNVVEIGGNNSLYNFVRTTTGAYMVITIPINGWRFSTTTLANHLRITMVQTNAQGYYLDWIQLQGGMGQGTGTGATGVTSVAASGNIFVTPVVTNPNTNVNIALNTPTVCAYCVPINQTNAVATPIWQHIDLGTPTVGGFLDPIKIFPGAEGSFLQTVSGVPIWSVLPTGFDSVFVLHPLVVRTGLLYDTLTLPIGVGTTSDSAVVLNRSTGLLEMAQITGGGGGGNTIYTANDAVVSDRTVDQAGFFLKFINGSDVLLYTDPANFIAGMKATNGTSTATFDLGGNSGDNLTFDLRLNDGVSFTRINADGDAHLINYTAATHVFAGSDVQFNLTDSLFINSTLSGSSSGYVWTLADPTTGSGYWGPALTGADNGLTDSLGRVILGGTLYKNTTINNNENTLTLNGTPSGISSVLDIEGTGGSGRGMTINSDGFITAFFTNSNGNPAVYGKSTGGVPADFETSFSTTNNTSVRVMELLRTTSGTPVAGFGTFIGFINQTNGTPTTTYSNTINSVWSNATGGSETATLFIQSANAGANLTTFSLSGNGALQLPHYGAGAATFDASGNITSVSDERLKNISGYYTSGIDKLMNINPIAFSYNSLSGLETEHTYLGFSAQNIRESLGDNAIGINSEGYLSIQDRAIMATMLNGIKELELKVEALQYKVIQLERK